MARWSLQPAALSQARILLIPTAFGPDTQAPAAILKAGADLCAFEPLLGIDVDSLLVGQSPAFEDEPPFGMCESAVQHSLRRRQLPILVPSVMSASWGAIRGVWKQTPALTVVHCSAHANLLPNAEQLQPDQDPGYSTNAWIERIYQYQLNTVHVGLRSTSQRAAHWLKEHQSPVFWAQSSWDPADVVAKLPSDPVFLAIDCSVLDPAVIPSVAQPEPGGLSWDRLLQTCQAIFAARPVLGISLGGLNVSATTRQSVRPVARLLNWLLACHELYREQNS